MIPIRTLNVDIDIAGACNLRCPSCPVGNWTTGKNDVRLMTLDTFNQILTKLKREWRWPRRIGSIRLYNWGDSLLHPEIDMFIESVHLFGLQCWLSTNLNFPIERVEQAGLAQPHLFYVSLSGFNQERYSQTHTGGDIMRVRANLEALAHMKKYWELDNMIIRVGFHLYNDNIEEAMKMRDFCNVHEIEFTSFEAIMQPLEKSLEYAYGSTGHSLTNTDLNLISKLCVDPKDELDPANKNKRCYVLDHCLHINSRGMVQLCGYVYDEKRMSVAPFLSSPLKDIRQARRQHPFCDTCMSGGGHIYTICESTQWN